VAHRIFTAELGIEPVAASAGERWNVHSLTLAATKLNVRLIGFGVGIGGRAFTFNSPRSSG
jgi:hypothetical protein